MTLRLVGTCPVCERQQKVTPDGAMVHHGFRRPGWGRIIGDCFGVGWPAYELSPKGCEAYRKNIVAWRTIAEQEKAHLESRPETITTEPDFRGRSDTYQRDSEDPAHRHAYEMALRRLITQTEYTIRSLDHSYRRMTELIDRWQKAPLIEIDEEGFTPAKREKRAQRKVERDTKRAEKEQKRQELANKRKQRLALKATQLLFFFDEFERLSLLPPSAERDQYARDLVFEMAKKKYGINYPQDLRDGPDDGNFGHTPGPWGDATIERASRALLTLGVGKELGWKPYGIALWAEPIFVPRASGRKIRVPEPGDSTENVLEAIARRRRP